MLTDDPASRLARPARNYAQLPRFQRVKISVLGRYMLADRREFPCQVLEMSPGDALVIAPVAGKVGEKVIVYLDHLGRIEGIITEGVDGGFLMEVSASARKRDKLAAQLTWLANKDILDLPEDRRHERVVPD
ncbi:MAG: PilZ domain-containing protein, partial [Devosia sp.]